MPIIKVTRKNNNINRTAQHHHHHTNNESNSCTNDNIDGVRVDVCNVPKIPKMVGTTDTEEASLPSFPPRLSRGRPRRKRPPLFSDRELFLQLFK